jgi:hypothetical protein
MTPMNPDRLSHKPSPSRHALRGNSAAVAKVFRLGLTLLRLLSVRKVSAFCRPSSNTRAFITLLLGRIVLNVF